MANIKLNFNNNITLNGKQELITCSITDIMPSETNIIPKTAEKKFEQKHYEKIENALDLLKGKDGEKGEQGYSAYELWLQDGNTGSYDDFELYIKGEKGDKGDKGDRGEDGIDGIDGKDGYTPIKGIDYFDGKDGKDGKNGVDGKDGKDGINGIDGKTIETVVISTDRSRKALASKTISSLGTGHTPTAGREKFFARGDHVHNVSDIAIMVYPAAGIALSTGSAWDASIVDNSINWNTAYSWGDHAGLYDLIGTASGLMLAHEITYDHLLIATSLQPGDNVSELVNDSGYLTSVAFTDLTDVPSSYLGGANKFVRVKGDETGLEFTTSSESMAHVDLTDMPDIGGTNSDHDARYYTEAEVDANFLKLDQTTPQTISNGQPIFGQGLKITAGYDIRPSADSTTAINIANAAGTDFVIFDTTNKKMIITSGSPSVSLAPTSDSLNIATDSSTVQRIIAASDTGSTAPALNLLKARGTIASPTIVSS